MLNDTGRPLHFDIETGQGALSVLDAISTAGFANTVYTAPAGETSTGIVETAPSAAVADGNAQAALRSDRAPVGNCWAARERMSIANPITVR